MDFELDYYDLYKKMSPAVERYLDRYVFFPWQTLDKGNIDRMVDELYEEIDDGFPELRSAKGKAESLYRQGLLKTLLGLILLGSIFRRYSYYPGYGPRSVY